MSPSPVPTILLLLAIAIVFILNALTKRVTPNSNGLGFLGGLGMTLAVWLMTAIPIVSLLLALRPQWLVKKELRDKAKTVGSELLLWLRLAWIVAVVVPIWYVVSSFR